MLRCFFLAGIGRSGNSQITATELRQTGRGAEASKAGAGRDGSLMRSFCTRSSGSGRSRGFLGTHANDLICPADVRRGRVRAMQRQQRPFRGPEQLDRPAFGQFGPVRRQGASARAHAKTASEHLAPFPIPRTYLGVRKQTGLGRHVRPSPAVSHAIPRPCTCASWIHAHGAGINQILMQIRDYPPVVRMCRRYGSCQSAF